MIPTLSFVDQHVFKKMQCVDSD